MLELRQVNVAFGGVAALTDVTVSIPLNQVYGVIGPNGAGKSTLLNLISGHVAPTSGTVSLDGRRIGGLPPYRIARRGVARTFQPVRLLPSSTALEQIIIAQHRRGSGRLWQELVFNAETRRERVERRQRAEALLDLTHLQHAAHRTADTLAEGDQQRLAIACALAQAPEYLLLDEPTADLGEAEQRDFHRLVTEIVQGGVTIVLAEHDATLAMRVCDRVAVLHAGRLLAEGPAREVQVDPAVARAYGE